MKRRTLAAAATLALLAACSDDNPVWRNGEPPALIGDWRGTVAEGVITQFDAVCSMQTSGAIGCAFFDPISGAAAGALNGNLAQTGTLDTDGSKTGEAGNITGDLEGTAQLYATAGGMPIPMELSGEITDEGAQLELEWEGLSLIAIRQPGIASSLSQVSGTYTLDFAPGDSAALTIGADGVLTGQSASGCTLDGVVAPAAPGYSVNVTAAGCGAIDGQLAGFALKRGNEIVLTMFGIDGVIVTRGGA